MSKFLNYGDAIEAVKKGKLIARKGWNGKDMFVFMRPADSLSVAFVVDNVKSLPPSFKKYIKDQYKFWVEAEQKIDFNAYLCMKAADDSIVNGWLASQSDMLANDWIILDY